jgi:hypothetical protein
LILWLLAGQKKVAFLPVIYGLLTEWQQKNNAVIHFPVTSPTKRFMKHKRRRSSNNNEEDYSLHTDLRAYEMKLFFNWFLITYSFLQSLAVMK